MAKWPGNFDKEKSAGSHQNVFTGVSPKPRFLTIKSMKKTCFQ